MPMETFLRGMEALRGGFQQMQEQKKSAAELRMRQQDQSLRFQQFQDTHAQAQANLSDKQRKAGQEQQTENFTRGLANNSDFLDQFPEEQQSAIKAAAGTGNWDVLQKVGKMVLDQVPSDAKKELTRLTDQLVKQQAAGDKVGAAATQETIMAHLNTIRQMKQAETLKQGMSDSEKGRISGLIRDTVNSQSKENKIKVEDYLPTLQPYMDNFGKISAGGYEALTEKMINDGFSAEAAKSMSSQVVTGLQSIKQPGFFDNLRHSIRSLGGGTDTAKSIKEGLQQAFGPGMDVTGPPNMNFSDATKLRTALVNNDITSAQTIFNKQQQQQANINDSSRKFAEEKGRLAKDSALQTELSTQLGKDYKDVSDAEKNSFVSGKLGQLNSEQPVQAGPPPTPAPQQTSQEQQTPAPAASDFVTPQPQTPAPASAPVNITTKQAKGVKALSPTQGQSANPAMPGGFVKDPNTGMWIQQR